MTDYKENRETIESISRIEKGHRRKEEILRRKYRRMKALFVGIIMCLLFFIIVSKIVSYSNNNNKGEIDNKKENVSTTIAETTTKKKATYKIEAPKDRTRDEVYKILKQYAKEDDDMKKLYEQRKSFSKGKLNAVINNPEMINFVLGFKNKNKSKVVNQLTEEEMNEEDPLFIQWDDRWAYAKYGDSTMGFAGCGPTCIAMAIFSLTKNGDATPFNIANFSDENGYYVDGVGTSWDIFEAAGISYNVNVRSISMEKSEMESELDKGHKLICSVGAGDFTTGGHFVEIYGYTSKGFKVNDPYCIARSKKKWSYERLKKQMRCIWSYSTD